MPILLAVIASAWARPPSCDIGYPIAGSAGLIQAEAARETHANVYSASAFSERQAIESGLFAKEGMSLAEPSGFFALQMDWHFGAARVPTLCGDPEPPEGPQDWGLNPHGRWEKKDRVYEEPLDLYATNYVIGLGLRSVGAFYSAAATQSVLGQRLFAVPAQGFNAAAMFAAPFVGNSLDQDGVTSYNLEWIAGVYVDTPWLGARAGYAGSRGFYATVDERGLGVFGTLSTTPIASSTPWDYLRLGMTALGPRRFGADDLADKTGASNVYLRDVERAGGVGVSDAAREAGLDRLRTFHLEQRSIAKYVDVELSANLVDGGLYEGHLGVHTPGFHPERGLDDLVPMGGWLRVGFVDVPTNYTLGVEGGRLFSARLQGALLGRDSPTRTELAVLFNDPEQLALFPFARNALELRATTRFVPMDP